MIYIIKTFRFPTFPRPVPENLSLVIFRNNLRVLLALPLNPIINRHLWANRWCTTRGVFDPTLLTLFPTISVCKPMFQLSSLVSKTQHVHRHLCAFVPSVAAAWNIISIPTPLTKPCSGSTSLTRRSLIPSLLMT